MIVVSDNSPLQYLVLIECIDVLPKLYGQVLTTPHVMQELSQVGTPDRVKAWASRPPPWLRIESPVYVDFLDVLDSGEASAISLARERNADLILIDERSGANAARNAGIQGVGTLGVLIEAGLERLIDFDRALERLTTETSFYYSTGLIASARQLFRSRSLHR